MTLQVIDSSKHSNRIGFTLIEVLVVLGLLGILAGMMTPVLLQFQEHLEVTRTTKELESLGSGLELYFYDTGQFPSNADGISALTIKPSSNPVGWSGPYVTPVPSNDSWEQPYQYLQYPTLGSTCHQTLKNCAILISNGPNLKAEWTYVGGVLSLNAGDDLNWMVSAQAIQKSYKKEVIRRLQTTMNEMMQNQNVVSFDDLKRGRLQEKTIQPTLCPTSDLLTANDRAVENRRNIDDIPNLSIYEKQDPWGNRFVWHPTLNLFYSCGPDQLDSSSGGTTLSGDDIGITY